MNDRNVWIIMSHIMCKICSSATKYYGKHDLSKGCNGDILQKTGTIIEYYKCVDCGLIFTVDMDNWSKDDFVHNIYNDEYIVVDPEYVDIRPRHNAEWLHDYIGYIDGNILDYGGGNGRTAEYMRLKGYTVDVYDEFSQPVRPSDKYDIVTAIEVFEHTTKPYDSLEDIISFLKINGEIVFTTFTNDLLSFGEMHWYISPRNGHVTIHSKKSLKILLSKYGLKLEHIGDHTHIAKFQ